MSSYTFATAMPDPIEQVRPRVEAALRDEGFGVLTEIDVAATLRAKLGLERSPYLILGACNPRLAHRALEIDPITISEGAVFLVCDDWGDVPPGAEFGLYDQDTRFLSRFELRLDGQRPVLLAAVDTSDAAAPPQSDRGPRT